jgi:hypothetical protein
VATAQAEYLIFTAGEIELLGPKSILIVGVGYGSLSIALGSILLKIL